MRLLGILAVVAIVTSSTALAQHGDHHGNGGGMGMGSGHEQTTMSCCEATTDMCDPDACPGRGERNDAGCDMTTCMGDMMEGMGEMMEGMGDMMGGMGDMMTDHHAGSAATMMCGDSMKCCKKKCCKKKCCKQKKDDPHARAGHGVRRLPTLR